MKRFQKWMMLVAMAALLAVGCAAESTTGSKVVSLHFEQGSDLAGTVLDAGVYEVRVDRVGSEAEITVMRGHTQLAKAKGKFVDITRFNIGNAVGYDAAHHVVRLEAGALKGAVLLTPAAGQASKAD
ncbi:MAG TPA: hypothetical protein VGL89_06455 [Candidatus Koribacter sp.]|jgi:hypothetical protein